MGVRYKLSKKCKRKLIHSACRQRKFQADTATRAGGNFIQISSFVYDRFGTNGLINIIVKHVCIEEGGSVIRETGVQTEHE